MKTYSMTFKNWIGQWEYAMFQATCDTDARFIARSIFRDAWNKGACGFTLYDFNGNYIDL